MHGCSHTKIGDFTLKAECIAIAEAEGINMSERQGIIDHKLLYCELDFLLNGVR